MYRNGGKNWVLKLIREERSGLRTLWAKSSPPLTLMKEYLLTNKENIKRVNNFRIVKYYIVILWEAVTKDGKQSFLVSGDEKTLYLY